MDVVLLSRWQFAITTIYHFLFVPVTLGLTIFLALLETCYVTTKREHWKEPCKKLIKFFGAIFLVNFAMGVVTGIVQEFHFGMNWSEYSRFMGDIFGAPLAMEALTAFFLESTFLGIWVFGWDKLPEKVHCACMWLVAIGSNLSAFWILVANSFMQHPVGFAVENGRAIMTDFVALITNPYVIGEMSHTIFSGVATSGFVLLIICAWKIARDESSREIFLQVTKAVSVYLIIGIMGAMGTGHLHAQYLAEAQPMKLSSVEALWETADPAPFAVVADINQEKRQNDAEITVPGLFSFMLYNKPEGAVQGINQLQTAAENQYGPGNYIPDVTGLFWSFRIMIACGIVIAGLGFLMGGLAWIKQDLLLKLKGLLTWMPLLLPLPFLANTAGWYIAEAGRQPWIVVGLQKTADAVSPNLTTGEVFLTMAGFTLIYLILAVAAFYIACRIIKNTTIEAVNQEGRAL
ncbi:MAG: cytochrome ubiquinol oxidase subunit I [Anaerovibrio sp.]|uniref:cytochrome ubiquinol oxidase subunit I n=1 Tax=Anaerovibrio sp. TaxID=1872532 RepID=UPI0025E9ECA1|nr:cytochrome ubiquinol oxidase subunit I [Anaerovibrio sp.]MCR5175520.1 cytochrome ubiquinol oxidase subunit I [Anaerovibrio sp.]